MSKSQMIKMAIAANLLLLFGCQPPIQITGGKVINRANPYFLEDARVSEKTNPHKDEKCFVCHRIDIPSLLREPKTEDESIKKRAMRTDLVALCVRCHKKIVEVKHPVGIPARLNRDNLPLDHNNNITCAITCHDVHTKNPDFIRTMQRKPFNALCLSCHDM